MSEELKPCPFCGDTPHLMDDPTDGGKRFWWTECRECGALNAYFRTKGEAIAAWNRRALTPEIIDAIVRSVAIEKDIPDWRALAQELATALGKFVGYTLSGDVYYFSPETHDLLARARKAGLEV